MNERLMQKIRDDFDRLALYDRQEWNHNNHYHRFILKQLPDRCRTLLDIGCGVGEFSRLLAQRVDSVIAVDLSPKTIEVAKQRSKQHANIDFQVGDILQWEFAAEQFDAIVSIATLHHLPVETLLPLLKYALKPGGKLIILDLLEYESLSDRLSDAIAVPLNWIFQLLKNRHIKPSPEAVAAMREHLRTDNYLTLSQAQSLYKRSLPRVGLKKHLFWRYSVVWEKPLTTS
jgi:SAM-dependent methyltransferase